MIIDEGENLASDGAVGTDLGVAVGEQLEINDGDETISIIEELYQMIHNEIWAVRAERLVVQGQRDFLRLGCGDWSPSSGSGEQRGDDEEEAWEMREGKRIHWGLWWKRFWSYHRLTSQHFLLSHPQKIMYMPSKIDKIYIMTPLAATS